MKISSEKIGKYLREISVVVIGVAITLSVSYWITSRKEKRDIALDLNTIKLELEENLKTLDEYNQDFIQRSVNYSNYLRSHDKKSLNVDTLKYYTYINPVVFNVSPIMIKTSAFEMFKTSGSMRLVNNRELLLSIWDSYTNLVELKENFDMMSQIKLEEMKNYFYLNENPPDEVILKNPPMYEFFTNMYVPDTQKRMSERTMTLLNETISKFE